LGYLDFLHFVIRGRRLRGAQHVHSKHDGAVAEGGRRRLALGGWHTEILAPFLSDNGHLIEAGSPKCEQKIKANPAVFGHIVKVIRFAPPLNVPLGEPNSADTVLTFRSAHD
jgi:hypothetical protein